MDFSIDSAIFCAERLIADMSVRGVYFNPILIVLQNTYLSLARRVEHGLNARLGKWGTRETECTIYCTVSYCSGMMMLALGRSSHADLT